MIKQAEQPLLILVQAQVKLEHGATFVHQAAAGPIDTPAVDAKCSHVACQPGAAAEDLQGERLASAELEAILPEVPCHPFLLRRGNLLAGERVDLAFR